MHSYLRAIGYSNVKTHEEEEALVLGVVKKTEKISLTTINKTSAFVEYSDECAEFVGITVRGEMGMENGVVNGKFHAENYFPYLEANCLSLKERIYVSSIFMVLVSF